MKAIYLTIAGFVIKIVFTKTEESFSVEQRFLERLMWLYKGFIINKPLTINNDVKFDFEVRIQFRNTLKAYKSDKDFYINLFSQSGKNKIVTFYSLSDEQFYLVIRTACQQLLSRNKGFFMHGSASSVLNKANVFLGDSGAGKSTIMKILSEKFNPLADDSLIIRQVNKDFYFYSSAAQEKNSWFDKKGSKYDLGNMFFLKKSTKHNIKKINNKELIISKLMGHYFSEDDQIQAQTKTLMKFINQFNNVYELEFSLNNTPELMQMIYLANKERAG